MFTSPKNDRQANASAVVRAGKYQAIIDTAQYTELNLQHFIKLVEKTSFQSVSSQLESKQNKCGVSYVSILKSDYLSNFFSKERSESYFEKQYAIICEIQGDGVSCVDFQSFQSQLHQILLQSLFEKKNLLSSGVGCNLVISLVKIMELESAMLNQVYMQKMVENVTEGIAEILGKNAEIQEKQYTNCPK